MRLGLSSIVLCTYVEKETTKQQTCVRLACTVWLHCHGNQQATNHAVPAWGQTEGGQTEVRGLASALCCLPASWKYFEDGGNEKRDGVKPGRGFCSFSCNVWRNLIIIIIKVLGEKVRKLKRNQAEQGPRFAVNGIPLFLPFHSS